MNRVSQKQLIVDLLTSLRNDMLQAIDDNKVPADWDGIELRGWLLDRVNTRVVGGLTKSRLDRRTKRGKAFINTILVNGL